MFVSKLIVFVRLRKLDAAHIQRELNGSMLCSRVTYEMMESCWPAVARGAEEAPPAMREWAVKLEAKPKYVVSSTRKDFPWTNSHHIAGDLHGLSLIHI